MTAEERMLAALRRLVIIAAVFVVAMLGAAVYALAHDHGRELGDWYKNLKSGNGLLCCNGDDFVGISDPDWESRDGRYRVRIEGQWWDVPDEAVIKEANHDGRTLVWPVYERALGGVLNVKIRCFLPGAMT
jgi:hypothetical protein